MHLDQIFYVLTASIILALTITTLHRLLQYWWRTYYLLALILTLNIIGVVPFVASYISAGNWSLPSAQKLYWILALSSQLTIFSFLLQLIFRTGRDLPAQGTLIRTLSVAAIVIALVSAASHAGQRLNTFMTLLTRDMTFLSALLNLVLWRFLLQLRHRDFLLLAVSAGLGIQSTGDAIGHSLRMLGKYLNSWPAFQEAGDMVMSMSGVITIVIWHSAFVRAKSRLSFSRKPPDPGDPPPAKTRSAAA